LLTPAEGLIRAASAAQNVAFEIFLINLTTDYTSVHGMIVKSLALLLTVNTGNYSRPSVVAE